MASTNGTKTKPLPPSLVQGLESLGFVELAGHTFPSATGERGARKVHVYALPRHPHLKFMATASNIPGDTAVIAEWQGHYQRLEADAWLVEISVDVQLADQNAGVR